ncbi:MAG: nuclear transport factor 2 family protein [Acetobacteraceae bacterium]
MPDQHETHAHIFTAWHRAAQARDTPALLALYAADAVLESPLVPAILDDKPDGVLRGQVELAQFFEEGGRSRPIELVRWWRDGTYLSRGDLLVWEYPRATPDGEQVDILEVMRTADGLIRHHRIYWGWFGTRLLIAAATRHALSARPPGC